MFSKANSVRLLNLSFIFIKRDFLYIFREFGVTSWLMLDIQLSHVLSDGSNNVIRHIKIVMGHSIWEVHGSNSFAFAKELFGVLNIYEFILLAVDEETGALCLLNFLNILKSFSNKIRSPASSNVFNNISDCGVWRHQNQHTWVSMSSQMSGGARSDGSSKDKNILRVNAHLLSKEIKNNFSIFNNGFRVCFTVICTVSRILNREDVSLETSR